MSRSAGPREDCANRPAIAELRPPPAINHVGDGDFGWIGQTFLRYFIEVCALQPHEQVLDVGCGVGRIALPLAGYLNAAGRYEGLDVQAEAIAWCQKNITPRYPNFRFCLADIYNLAYNPGGRYPASAYRFPYADATFDFVCLTSVFTHLLPADMENYFAEIARVLKLGGRCLITFYLTDQDSARLTQSDASASAFPHDRGHYRVENDIIPEAAVCYDGQYVRGLYRQNGFEVTLPAHYGSWRCRSTPAGGQDMVVATKVRSTPPRTGLKAVGIEAEDDPARKIRQMLREIAQVRRVVRRVVPADATVLVVSRGDENLVKLRGCRMWHFPQTEDGVYAGHHPADSAEAIAHLESLRAKGAGYLLIPRPAFWWLEYYSQFKDHLERQYSPSVRDSETCLVFNLGGSHV